MPGWLEAFAKVNPVTVVVNAVRALSLGSETATRLQGGTTFTHVWQALAWMIGLLVVFIPLAVRVYRKST
jgi:ABC-type polysaccharide/polyol phosphate export permease